MLFKNFVHASFLFLRFIYYVLIFIFTEYITFTTVKNCILFKIINILGNIHLEIIRSQNHTVNYYTRFIERLGTLFTSKPGVCRH